MLCKVRKPDNCVIILKIVKFSVNPDMIWYAIQTFEFVKALVSV